jgi:hypothetical protein
MQHRCVAKCAWLTLHTVGVLATTLWLFSGGYLPYVVRSQAVAVPAPALPRALGAPVAPGPRPLLAVQASWLVPTPAIAVGARFQVFVYDYHEPAVHPGLAHAQLLVVVPAALRREDNGVHLDCVRVLDSCGRSLGWVAHSGLPAVRCLLDSGATYTATFMRAKYNQHRQTKQVHGPTLTLIITALADVV